MVRANERIIVLHSWSPWIGYRLPCGLSWVVAVPIQLVFPFFNGVVLFRRGPRRVPDGREAGPVDGHPPYDESIPGHEGQVGRAPKIEVRERPHDVVVVCIRDQQRVLR